MGSGVGFDQDASGRGIRLQLDVHAVERQRMAQRNPLGRAFRRLDASDPSRREDVPLGCSPTDDEIQGIAGHPHGPAGDADPMGQRLLAHVHHVGTPLRIQV